MDMIKGPAEPPSLGHTLEKTIEDALALVRAEIALAKREATDKLGSLAKAAIFVFAGTVFLQAGLTSLGVLLLLTLRGTALGFVVVAGFFAVAGVLALVGVRLLKDHPSRTPDRLKLDGRALTEALK